jgi:16S rRNA (cytidine1402-2'-O)-methyltransferase
MASTSFGKLYLIPVPIAANTYKQVLPEYNKHIVQQIEHFIVEDISTARRYIKIIEHPKLIADLQFYCLDKHNPIQDMSVFMHPLKEGKNIGVLAEAGCPGIADPGAWTVQYAHKNGIEVIPLVGPCSILLALMASGFNGQNFAFCGYLPIDKADRKQTIKKLETVAWQSGQTQIFIETPYRNESILEILLEVCRPTTWLCIGKNITDSKGWIKSNTIQHWKLNKPSLHKVPTVFLLAGQAQF